MEKNKSWIWKAYDPICREIVAWESGPCDDRTLKSFFVKLALKERLLSRMTGGILSLHTGKNGSLQEKLKTT